MKKFYVLFENSETPVVLSIPGCKGLLDVQTILCKFEFITAEDLNGPCVLRSNLIRYVKEM